MNALLKQKERIWYWDNVKFFLILTVVIGHFFELIMTYNGNVHRGFVFVYAFHMPLFMFVSGLFFKSKKWLRKIFFYIIAGYMLKGLMYCCNLILYKEASFTLLYEMGPAWFMFALAWYTAFGRLLKKANKRIVLAVAIVVALAVGYFGEVNDFLCLSRCFVFFPFFWLGTMFAPNTLAKSIENHRKKLMIPAVCIIAVWLLFCLTNWCNVGMLHFMFTGRRAYWKEIYSFGCLYRLLAYAISLLVSGSVLFLIPYGKLKHISHMGSNTLNVYFWHYLILKLAFDGFGMANYAAKPWIVPLSLLLAVLLTVILSTDIFKFPLKYLQDIIINPQKSILKSKKNRSQ